MILTNTLSSRLQSNFRLQLDGYRSLGSKENRKFTVEEGEELMIVSYYDSNGKARPDAIKEMTYAFSMGYVAKVRVADERLNVVRLLEQ